MSLAPVAQWSIVSVASRIACNAHTNGMYYARYSNIHTFRVVGTLD